MPFSPAIAGIAVAILMGLAFSGGVIVQGWRTDEVIARLESDNTVKSAANQVCARDIAAAQKAVSAMLEAAEERERQAQAAIDEARARAAKHSATAIKIKAAPLVPGESMCDAIVREQREYVTARAE